MKIRSVAYNNRRKNFEVRTARGTLSFPYSSADPAPSSEDPVREVAVDRELGREGFTYETASGREGAIHLDQVLSYNQDPSYMRDALLYRLTIEAQRRVEDSPLSKRENEDTRKEMDDVFSNHCFNDINVKASEIYNPKAFCKYKDR
jgi:hypothetical protein